MHDTFSNVFAAFANVLDAFTNMLGAFTNMLGVFTNMLDVFCERFHVHSHILCGNKSFMITTSIFVRVKKETKHAKVSCMFAAASNVPPVVKETCFP